MGLKEAPVKQLPNIPCFSAGVVYGCFNNNISNALKSVTERFLYIKTADGFGSVPEPRSGFLNKLDHFTKLIKAKSVFIPRMDDDLFIGSYEGRKQRVYKSALSSLKTKPFTHKDAYVAWFLKMEKVQIKENKDTVPRGISPRHPRYHVSLGPYIKPMEKVIYKTINEIFGGVTVFKGLNASQRGRELHNIWKSFKNPLAIPIDAKRFDQHVSIDMLRWEHSIYQMFNNSKHLGYLLSLQLRNKFFVNLKGHSFKFRTTGKRCSGDMNTSLGNVLIMCGMMYSYLSSRVKHFRIADDGDDCIIFIEKRDVDKISDLYTSILEFGFQLEIEAHVDQFEKIEFCQAQPVFINGEWLMVRKPLNAMAKDSMSVNHFDIRGFRRWMRQVAECGLSLSSSVPIMQTFYTKMYELGQGDALENKTGNLSGMEYLAKGMKHIPRQPTDEDRLSFWRSFGITPDQQVLIENYIHKLEVWMDFTNLNSRIRDLPL